jgi:hypothetical protein
VVVKRQEAYRGDAHCFQHPNSLVVRDGRFGAFGQRVPRFRCYPKGERDIGFHQFFDIPDDFQFIYDGMNRFLRKPNFPEAPLPNWDRVLVGEMENDERSDVWIPMEEFESRFQDIRRRTTRWWINLNAYRIKDGVLYLVVEYISLGEDMSGLPPGKRGVALSAYLLNW